VASSGFRIKVGLDSTAAERGLANIGRSAKRLNKSMGRLAGRGMKLGAGIAVASGAMAVFAGLKFIKDSSRVAADFEKMALGFTNIMGSAAAATKRIKELQAMSVKTPFTPTELMEASKILQIMGGSAAGIGQGLTLVGDAAAVTGEDLQVVANNVALLFSALTAGGEFGEAANQLQRMGILNKDVKDEMKKTWEQAKAGTRGWLDQAEALEIVSRGLAGTAGSMADFAESVGGKISTMQGHFEQLQIAFGEGINKGLVVGIDMMNRKIPELMEAAKKLGDVIGLGIGQALQGNTRLLELQITYLMEKLAEVAAGVFTQAIGQFFGGVLPKIMQGKAKQIEESWMGKIPGVKPAAQASGLAWKMLEQPMAAAFDFSDFQDLWSGQFGTPETMDEILVELKGIRREQPKEIKGEFIARPPAANWGMDPDVWPALEYR